MRRTLTVVAASVLLASGAATCLVAQIYGPPPYRLPRYPQPHPPKAHRYKGDQEVNRTIRNLQTLDYPVLTKDQRKTAEKSIKDLQEFQKKRYEGKFDDKRMNRILQSLDKLATSPNFTDKDRDRLAADMQALRHFQATETGAKVGAP